MAKTIKARIEDLERSRSGTGLMYFVHVVGDVFTLQPNGADVVEALEMNEAEFAKWENTKGENDCVFVIKRREDAVKDGSDV